MNWQAYRLVFRLESPLHIGWRKISNLMQTRYYVPGRVWWGAVTANLTQWLRGTDYRATGEWVRKNLRFGYFFPAEDIDKPLYPRLSKEGTLYGHTLPETEFESRFLDVLASTAITHEANVAAEGSLHEVEFLKPSVKLGQPVYLVGHLLVHPDKKIIATDNDVETWGLSLFSQVMASLQIGGERRYGFGRLTLCRDQCRPVEKVFDCFFHRQEGQLTVPKEQPLPAHAIASNNLSMDGSIEPLVSREWAPRRGPGRRITLLGLCYVPGSRPLSDTTFTIGPYGILGGQE